MTRRKQYLCFAMATGCGIAALINVGAQNTWFLRSRDFIHLLWFLHCRVSRFGKSVPFDGSLSKQSN